MKKRKKFSGKQQKLEYGENIINESCQKTKKERG